MVRQTQLFLAIVVWRLVVIPMKLPSCYRIPARPQLHWIKGFPLVIPQRHITLWDTLIGAGGFSIFPGYNVILSATTNDNFDGSDIPLTDAVIKLILNGDTYNISDTAGILTGFGFGISSADETFPWIRSR